MLARMPYRIFEEWVEFHREEPFGQMPFRMAYAGALLGTLLSKPKGKSAWEPADFMPDPSPEEPIPNADRNLNQMLFVASMMGAEVIDKEGKLERMLGA